MTVKLILHIYTIVNGFALQAVWCMSQNIFFDCYNDSNHFKSQPLTSTTGSLVQWLLLHAPIKLFIFLHSYAVHNNHSRYRPGPSDHFNNKLLGLSGLKRTFKSLHSSPELSGQMSATCQHCCLNKHCEASCMCTIYPIYYTVVLGDSNKGLAWNHWYSTEKDRNRGTLYWVDFFFSFSLLHVH